MRLVSGLGCTYRAAKGCRKELLAPLPNSLTRPFKHSLTFQKSFWDVKLLQALPYLADTVQWEADYKGPWYASQMWPNREENFKRSKRHGAITEYRESPEKGVRDRTVGG
jgi:hypothetical protein